MQNAKTESLSQDGTIVWFRVELQLRCAEVRRKTSEPTETVIASLVKHACRLGGVRDTVEPVFHGAKRKLPPRMHPETRTGLYVILPTPERSDAEKWSEGLLAWLNRCREQSDVAIVFELDGPPEVQRRTVATLEHESPCIDRGGIGALVFSTGLATRDGKRPTGSQIMSFITSTLREVLGSTASVYVDALTQSRAKTLFLEPCQFRHRPKSNDGEMNIRCFSGPVGISGVTRRAAVGLLLASEFHVGRHTKLGLGRFECRNSYGVLDPKLVRVSFLRSVVEKMIEKKETDPDILIYLLEPEAIRDVVDRISNGFRHRPFSSFYLESGENRRLILKPEPEDMVIEKAAAQLIEPVWERVFADTSYGYRRGRGRKDAKERLKGYLQEGCEWVFESDIDSFFDSLSWEHVSSVVDEHLPPDDEMLRTIVDETVRAPRVSGSVVSERTGGIPTGSPLSPLIANLVLTDFDNMMMERGHRLIRYADDFLVMARSRDEAKRARADAEEMLNRQGLRLNTDKTAMRHIADGSLEFLGYRFPEGIGAVHDASAVLKKTLYVQTEGSFVGVEQETVVVKKHDSIIGRIPIHRIDEVTVMGDAAVSTRLLQRCAEEQIPVTFCSHGGYVFNTLRPDSKAFFGRIHLHHRRFEETSRSQQLGIARDLVQAQLANYTAYLKTRYSAEIGHLVRGMRLAVERAANAESLDQLRGFEGNAGKTLFAALRIVIGDEAFHSSARRRRNPDRLNSLLNFGSYLLFSLCNATLRNAGLDPYLGFLHSHRDNYESLVCDLMEPFRFRVIKMIVKAVNCGKIREDDFYSSRYGERLRADASKRFVLAFETEFARKLAHDPANGTALVATQVESLLRWVERGSLIHWYRRQER